MKKLFESILDLLLPRSKDLKKLENMTAGEFREEAGRNRPASSRNGSDNTLILFDYKHPLVRQAVWELKYRGNKKIARLLAECLYEELAEELALRKALENFDKPILIPIPLSKKRERERGFNQCELLADELETLDGKNFFEVRFDLLIKTKDTESQTKKNRAERLENLNGCFSVARPEKISNRNIILLDDVMTTGATFEEARRTLRRESARKILCLAIAH